ncbi:MAG: helical backbone metal receptor [Desulfurococcales archaeon]|nr:helical backbone metal receptor [Desulfurococcales archaeon]
MSRGSTTTLVYASLLIAIISLSLAGALFYKTYKSIDEVNSKIDTLKSNIKSINNTKTIKDLEVQIAELNKSLATVATVDQLQEVASKLASLERSLKSLKETQSGLAEDIATIKEKIKELEERMKFPVTVVDGTGEDTIIESKPTRIVSLAPSVTEILYYVNATDRLVGVDSYSNFPEWIPEARENGTLTDVGGFFDPSVEKILSVNPDLVIGVVGVPAHEHIKNLFKAYNIPVILLPQASLSDIERSILIVGKATGNIDESIRAAADFESKLARIKYANYTTTPRIALIVWLNPIWVAGNSTFQSEALYWAGARNAFENISGWASIDIEQLLVAKPDIIIAVGINASDVISTVESQLGDSAGEIPAIADGRVYCIGYPYSDLFNRPSPRIVDAIIIIQLIAHPELYNMDRAHIPACINNETLPEVPEPPAVS